MTDKDALLAKEQNISLIPNWLMLNNAIRSGNLQILAKVLKQTKHSLSPVKPNSHSFIFAIWSANPDMLEEVVKMAKKKHGIDYVPDFNALSYAVLGGSIAMVEKVMEMASMRKSELLANFNLLNFAAWSNNSHMIDTVHCMPKENNKPLPSDIKQIIQKAEKENLNKDILDAVTSSGTPAMLHRIIAVAHKHEVEIPKPTKKTLCNAIKAGGVEVVDEIFKLAQKSGVDLRIDEDIYNAADWSDNPAMKSYLKKFESD